MTCNLRPHLAVFKQAQLKMSLYNKVAVAVCDHQKCKLRAVAGADGFWVAKLRVRQVKIGRKSCFANLISYNNDIILFCQILISNYHYLNTFGEILTISELPFTQSCLEKPQRKLSIIRRDCEGYVGIFRRPERCTPQLGEILSKGEFSFFKFTSIFTNW